MSERTYAPRSGGRTAEQNATTGARRHPAKVTRTTQEARTEGTAALRLDPAPAERSRVKGRPDSPAPRLRVAPPAAIRAPRTPFIALVIVLVVAGVLGILLVNTKTMENSFELSRLEDEQRNLDKRQQQLENQLADYESAGNLDAAAKRAGLVKGEPAYIRLPDGQIIGVAVPGQGKKSVTAQDQADAAAGHAPAGSAPVDAAPGTGR
ncbi:hypothetical protein AB0M54_07895 [Actinoplanes sp. NPDC051470]|uniref:hypothetical protein n=1 Tax=unclassified Actinoplanes TaxID=2626549 RepID=UPI003429B934